MLRILLAVLMLAAPAAGAEPPATRLSGAYELKADGRIVRLPPIAPPGAQGPSDRARRQR
ncbi:MAG: hypothetical protein AB7O45_13690 [Alphaproteobacteria bacterium]